MDAFLEAPARLVLGLLNSPLWPCAFLLALVVHLAFFVLGAGRHALVGAGGSCVALWLWCMRGLFLPSLGFDKPQGADAGHGYLYAGVIIIAIVVLVGVVATASRRAEASVPVVLPSQPSVLSWLCDIETMIPLQARAAFIRIRAHITELSKLKDQHSGELPEFAIAKTMVGTDLRDLLVRYKRVELARNLLPNMATLGDSELNSGFANIEAALVEVRKAAATSVLTELSIQERYVELKHGPMSEVDATLRRNGVDE